MIKSTHRFHGRSSLRFVYQRGQITRGDLLSLRSVLNDRQQAYRVAVVVSRKVSKSAVVRNRIRRRLYEIVRKNADRIVGPHDLVFSVYGEEAASLSHATLEKMILRQLARAGVVRSTDSPETKHDIILSVADDSASRIHSAKQNAARKGEAVPVRPGRRKGETPSGFTPPSNHKETNN